MTRLVALNAVLFLALSPAGADQGKGKGRGKGHDKVKVVVFQPADRNTIVTYYRAQPGGLPPGLAKKDLPPGLQKQLRRNGRLPPGLEKKLVAFPPEIETRLPPCPPDVQRGLIGGVAVMWNSRTGLIIDAAVLF
jgi:hypothetical protein